MAVKFVCFLFCPIQKILSGQEVLSGVWSSGVLSQGTLRRVALFLLWYNISLVGSNNVRVRFVDYVVNL